MTVACDYCGLPVPGCTEGTLCEPVFCCFGCRFADTVTRERDDETATRWTLTRLGLSVFFAMNVMVFTMARWSHDVYEQDSGELSSSLHGMFRYLCLLLTLPVMTMLGVPLFKHAIDGLKQRRLTSELLIVVGVVAAFVFSTVSVFRGTGHTYFEVACMVLVLVTFGRWIEATGRVKASAVIEKLQRLLPDTVTKILGAEERDVATDTLEIGDHLRIRAGERFPVDGRIVSGRSTVDEQVFTGESLPVERCVGDTVLAGTVSLDGDIIIEASAGPGEGSFAGLLHILHTARTTRGHYERLADRVTAWFIPAVGAIALAVFIGHLQTGLLPAVMTSLSVVLIACPCALGLATPLAVWSALGRAAEGHVLFRNGEALERLATTRAVRFDKTGTLTDGNPHVTRTVLDPQTDAREVDGVANELSRASNHVFSRAISQSLDDQPASVHGELTDVRTVAGRGISATFAQDGPVNQVVFGSRKFIEDNNASVPSNIRDALEANADQSAVVLVAWDQRVRALFLIGEQLRAESRAAITACRSLGCDVEVLTGDHVERAAKWRDELGVPVSAGMTPEDKLKRVLAARGQHGSVAMVGDGINDAPALAAADVGISLGCGADVSRDSADVCVMSDDLSRIPWAIELSQRTRRIVRQNLAWAFGYNSAGILLASSGLLNPAIAAGLMLGSSLFVIVNSMRLSGFEADRDALKPQGTASHVTRPMDDTPASESGSAFAVPRVVQHSEGTV